jgi:GTP-binding protein
LYTTAVSRFPDVRFMISAAAPGQFPADSGVEVAFAGRSNAGKSSAINAITQRRAMARTSKTPGRTQLLNFFEVGAGQRIVDLPGYGYADVPERERRKWAPLIEALRPRMSLRGLFLIVDSRRGLSAADEELIAWAEGMCVHVLLAKADKLNRSEGAEVLRAATKRLSPDATVQLFSAHAKTGVEEAQKVLQAWLSTQKNTPATSDEIAGAD